MVSSVLIIIVSLVLFLYWFRYSCLLALQSRTAHDSSRQIAEANRLSFPEVQASLRNPEPVELDSLQKALDRDYRVLTYLFEHAGGLALDSIEQRLLLLDYRVMRLWYRLTRKISSLQARKALEEMSNIVVYFAGNMGQRLAQPIES